MSSKLFLIIVGLLFDVNYQAIDWCHMQSCRGRSHIACNNNGRFSPSCNSPKTVPLTSQQKNLLVDLHNKYRNYVASGQLRNFSPARRMAKVTWNDQLAWLAELNTKQCRMNHDPCHNTPSFKNSGQNLAQKGTSETYTTEFVIKDSLKSWFQEYSYASMRDINSYGSGSASGKIGHFTAMVTDRTTQIGCAISSFRTRSGSFTFNTYLLACNYASTNIIRCPVYKSGSAAQACTRGPDNIFKGLCKTSEPIDANGC